MTLKVGLYYLIWPGLLPRYYYYNITRYNLNGQDSAATYIDSNNKLNTRTMVNSDIKDLVEYTDLEDL